MSGLFIVVAFSLIAGVCAWGALQGKAPDTLTCLTIWFLLLGWGLGLFFINAYPSVEIDDRGLTIDFLWRKVFVDWSDVIGFRTRGFHWSGFALVLVKRATPFHLLYGWYFARTLKPGFLIHDSIDGFAELLDMVQRKARAV